MPVRKPSTSLLNLTPSSYGLGSLKLAIDGRSAGCQMLHGQLPAARTSTEKWTPAGESVPRAATSATARKSRKFARRIVVFVMVDTRREAAEHPSLARHTLGNSARSLGRAMLIGGNAAENESKVRKASRT